MNFFNSKNKFFLDMSKAEIISKSIVLVDSEYKGVMPQTSELIQLKQSPFSELASLYLLQEVVKKEGFKTKNSSEISQEFVFEDEFVFSHNLFPPKFTILHKTSDKNSPILKEIAEKMISFVKSSIGAIGVNYELSIDKNEGGNQINLREKICNSNIQNEFEAMSVNFVVDVDSLTKLNLKIADAKADEKEIIYITANFHNILTTENSIESILSRNFLDDVLQQKLDAIFGN
jgi:hypothetical protein